MEILGLRIRSIFSSSFPIRKLALKCWIMKGKKSQEIEVTSTSEQRKTCLASENCLRENVSNWCSPGCQPGILGPACNSRHAVCRALFLCHFLATQQPRVLRGLSFSGGHTVGVRTGTQNCQVSGCRLCPHPSECERGISLFAVQSASFSVMCLVEKTLN